MARIFIDNNGNTYDFATGVFVAAAGPDTADIDPAFGYSLDGGTNECKAGVTPSYADLVIGDLDTDAGYQGEVYSSNNTVLCRGLGVSIGKLLGAELKNSGGGGHDDEWALQLRDASTFAIIATLDHPNFVSDWFDAHPTEYSTADYTYDVHVSADPTDGSFWVNVKEGDGVIGVLPTWNVDPSDLSLIREVEIDYYAAGPTVRRMAVVATCRVHPHRRSKGGTNAHAIAGDDVVTIDPVDDEIADQLTIGAGTFEASGVNHKRGVVPDPGAVAGTAKFLREDATWAAPPGTAADVQAAGYWSPLTNGDPINPELVFDSFGNSVAVWTGTP